MTVPAWKVWIIMPIVYLGRVLERHSARPLGRHAAAAVGRRRLCGRLCLQFHLVARVWTGAAGADFVAAGG